MKKYIRKADIILFVILVVVGLACSIYFAMSKTAGSEVVIERAGKPYGTYSLNKDKTVEIRDGDAVTNVIVISNGSVRVESASCHNQVCVRHSAISATGESIVCLPNKLIVHIEGSGGGYDAISS